MKLENNIKVSYESVFNAMTDLIAVQDGDFNFLMLNDAYRREFKSFFGITIQVGDNMFEKLKGSGPQAAMMKSVWEKAYQEGTYEILQKFTGSDKKEGTYSIRFDALFDGSGKQIGMLHVVRNVSEKSDLAHRLEESQLRFKGAFETSSIGMAIVSPEGKWLQVNRALVDLLGYTEKELLQKTFQDVTYKDDLHADLKYVQDMISGVRETYRMEKRYVKKDGSILWVLLSVSLVRDSNDEPLYFVSQVQDIGTRKRIEEETKRSVDELAKMNQALVGRELKMRELKEELRVCKEKHENI